MKIDMEKALKAATFKAYGGGRGIRTLGPVKDYLISSQGRYDHFDSPPY
jgi:hypothetical protein